MLAYLPLDLDEINNVMGIPDDREGRDIKKLVDQFVSFIKVHSRKIGFVHQSARDYLAGENEQSILSHKPFDIDLLYRVYVQ